MRFSVIILTYNRREILSRCLAAATTVDYGDYEIIVVDDGSTDGSEEMVRRSFPQVRYLHHPTNSGIPAARNRGLRAASAEIIAFLDDDCVPPRDWLRAHARYHEDRRISAVGGPAICRTPNFFERFDEIQYAVPYEPLQTIDDLTRYEHLGCGNMSVRRTAIDDVGMFDEQFLNGEDADLSRRLRRAGHLLIRDHGLQVDHLKVHSFGSYLKMRFQRGCGSVLTDVKDGTLCLARFVPVPNVRRTWRNWCRFRQTYEGGPSELVAFWALALMARWVDVAGRAYYYWTKGRTVGRSASRGARSVTQCQ